MNRQRLTVIVGIVVAFGILSGAAQAGGFPRRPVTVIVPWPAGGTTDIAIRALAAATAKYLGQSIVGVTSLARAGRSVQCRWPRLRPPMDILLHRYP